MLIDGLNLVDTSDVKNLEVESVTAFPTTDLTPGRMVYLSVALTGYDPGMYTFNGTEWLTGDVTEVLAGTGLIGGGTNGVVSLRVDTNVIATQQFVLDTVDTVDGGLF